METLIQQFQGERWYPLPTSEYKSNLRLRNNTANKYQIKSNFAYNMQYLEFIQKQIEELCLSSVISTMCYKTYIIIGMSIIEMLFSSFLKATKNWKYTDLELISSTKSNFQKHEDKNLKTEVFIYKKIPKKEDFMNFDAMIKKIETKKLLPIEHEIYPALKKLKKLRNRIHLQECEHSTDHDYNNFDQRAYKLMKSILYQILTCSEFCNNKDLYNFLIN